MNKLVFTLAFLQNILAFEGFDLKETSLNDLGIPFAVLENLSPKSIQLPTSQ